MEHTTAQVEIFQIDVDNLRCGWCQAWLSNDMFMSHAYEHLNMLEEMRDDARLTITVRLPDPGNFSVEEL